MTVSIASALSIFIGLLVVVFNQSSQIIERWRPTEFVLLGVRTAQGTNRLITDNLTLGINSGTKVLIERIAFLGKDDLTSSLEVGYIIGEAYESADIATIRMNPTAIHTSYRPAPFEMLEILSASGIQKEKLPDLFKVRPVSEHNEIYKMHPWAAIAGKIEIDYFEPKRSSGRRFTEVYPSQLLLWVRKPDNLRERLENSYHHVDVQSALHKYNEVIKKYEIPE